MTIRTCSSFLSTTGVETRQREQIDIPVSLGACQAGAQHIVTDNRGLSCGPPAPAGDRISSVEPIPAQDGVAAT
jgi:hypothetical protein